MKKSFLNASNLRIVLSLILTIVIVISVGGFYFAQDWLRTYSTDTQAKNNSQPKTVSNTDNSQQQLKDDIANNKNVADKAASFVLPKNFQSKIKADIDKYASSTNVTITDFGLTNAPSGTNPFSPINGVSAKYLKITLSNPVAYTNLYKFIKAIETNIPKINLKGISIESITDSNGNVNVEPLVIEVFTR